MQVFIIGDALETFKCLDKRRLRKQLIECKQILSVYDGKTNAWKNHPIVKSYANFRKWLSVYTFALEEFIDGKDLLMLLNYNAWLKDNAPNFHTIEYFNQMKRRLYTKNKSFYNEFESLGESTVNWYYYDEKWHYYDNGKKVNYET